MDINRQQSVGLIIIRPKIRPFEDIPTENPTDIFDLTVK